MMCRDESEWLTTQHDSSPKLPLRFYLEAGLHEDRGWQHQLGHWWPPILESNRRLRNVLQAKGYEVHYHEFNGGHDLLCWRGTFADGLIALIGSERGSPPMAEDDQE
jgi:enterochelin esterase family protein